MGRQKDEDILNIIRTEYISDPKMSYRKLAEKHKFPLKKISKAGREENWRQLRVQMRDKILKKTINRISTEKSDDLAKVIRSTNKLLGHVEKALNQKDQFEKIVVVEGKDGDVTKVALGKADVKAMRSMAGTLKDIFAILKVAEIDDAAGQEKVIKVLEDDLSE